MFLFFETIGIDLSFLFIIHLTLFHSLLLLIIHTEGYYQCVNYQINTQSDKHEKKPNEELGCSSITYAQIVPLTCLVLMTKMTD
jgi:hypothetical protein